MKTGVRFWRGWVIGWWIVGVALSLFSPDLAIICTALAQIGFLVLLYQAWASIQDGYADVTAGSAIGRLFVPFYNL